MKSCTAKYDHERQAIAVGAALAQCGDLARGGRMLTLWRLPRAAVELAVGTMIVMVHLGLAARIERKALSERN